MPSYLPNLYQHIPDDMFLAVWTKSPSVTEFFSVAELENAEERMLEIAKSRDVYHSWTLLKHRPQSGRGTAADVSASVGVMFDADLFSEEPNVHKQTALPRTVDEVLSWLDKAGFERPTQIRSSGNGLYLDWLHPEPVVFSTDADRKVYGEQTKTFHAALRQSALVLRGWRFDNSSDLARVTRMPGTLNHKTNPPKAVEIVNV